MTDTWLEPCPVLDIFASEPPRVDLLPGFARITFAAVDVVEGSGGREQSRAVVAKIVIPIDVLTAAAAALQSPRDLRKRSVPKSLPPVPDPLPVDVLRFVPKPGKRR